jgi:transposase-like protein
MTRRESLYERYRFPAAIIQHAVWLYYRFDLSRRDIEDMVPRCRKGAINDASMYGD